MRMPNDGQYQIRALDKTRLPRKLGTVGKQTIRGIESCVLFILGIV